MNFLLHVDTLEKLPQIESDSVDMVLTDVPYLISRKTNFKSIKDFTKREGETKYSCMDFGTWDEEFDLSTYIKECCRILKPSRSIVVWAAWQQLKEIDDCIKGALSKKSGSPRIGIWEKSNPSVFNMQRMAIQPFEFFIWNRKGSNWIFNNQHLPQAERHLFKHSCITGGHPTAKPLPIFEYLIKTYTNEGHIVFDGVVGGGTTAVAAHNTGRKYICCEKDEVSYKLAIDALNAAGSLYETNL